MKDRNSYRFQGRMGSGAEDTNGVTKNRKKKIN
jgi:hypothetical protein